ncbi:DUF3524 domain-containing protein [Pleionea sp. CnH1-48]|uniref:tRNA-queuosine alpha-mannosyltransferase domain-containing protein n=1 Tax=Pleionea sp. CnH1-48 TaxID=2954494 RepID=UPI00209815A2|nr:DUF3524 domain-containing protein [Pleionea sp. CnH1-48]MCO7226944.1 DUF3524 domain-containing protein [Pleionea sp. CnH1-48]
MKKLLLLSAYDTPSHQYWRKGLKKHLHDYGWTQLALPARYFAWRTRGNSLSWGLGEYPELEQNYDAIIATSMVDITALRGFRPHLGQCPLLVYFHENQFDYPTSAHQSDDIQIKLTSIYNALCADQILFNSKYNYQTFVDGAKKLLKKMPDCKPNGLIDNIQQKAEVLPVPLDLDALQEPMPYQAQTPLDIVWNHRWEYDKNPEAFFAALHILKEQSIPFSLRILGQSFRHSPAIFEQAREAFAEHIIVWGYAERKDYWHHLSQANVVVSSSLHDFQGLALQEAIAYGAMPIAPARVAYPEYLPPDCLYLDQPENDAALLAEKLVTLYQQGLELPSNPVSSYLWQNQQSAYSQKIRQLVD